MRARWSSKSMAAWTCGSPKAYAKAKASTPAARPASMPRTSRARTMPASVAGEAEQVAAVVHELVDEGAGEQRRRALLGADEVHEHDEDHPGEQDVGQQLGGRCDRRGRGGGGAALQCDVGHSGTSSGSRVPSWVVSRGGGVSGSRTSK